MSLNDLAQAVQWTNGPNFICVYIGFSYISFSPTGVGVPLMLTYVYGVVPMSLCRNGWCRPQSEPPETHKIQLEDLASCEYRVQPL